MRMCDVGYDFIVHVFNGNKEIIAPRWLLNVGRSQTMCSTDIGVDLHRLLMKFTSYMGKNEFLNSPI